MARVAYIGGYWATNIGNAFFNLGADHVLRQVFGDENVSMVFDQTAYMPGWKTSKGNIPWAIDYWAHLQVDYVVLLGPALTRNFLAIWRDTLNQLKARGVRYMMLSAGMMKCDAGTIDEIKAFFCENPPYVMTTRDRDTYQTFSGYVPRIYDGICFAFFAPDTYHVAPTDLKPCIALNFDKIDEPYITVDQPDAKADLAFDHDGHHFSLRYSGLLSRIGLKTDRLTDALVYAMSPLPRGKRPEQLGPYHVIRTDHRFAPMFLRKVYRYPQSFCADIPQTYLNIYAESALTISDRVHACAITLAYGNAAYLLAKTGRSALLERVGANGISEHPVRIDLTYLQSEKQKLIDWMKMIDW